MGRSTRMKIEVSEEAKAFYDMLPEKDRRIIKEHLGRLAEFPHIRGDIEQLHSPTGVTRYRLHIARRYTAFYRVYEDDQVIRVLALMTIEQAHKRYKHYLKD
jgi:mRNA-degrading endonuclease RelE of RelBE toxin-antitoxin system